MYCAYLLGQLELAIAVDRDSRMDRRINGKTDIKKHINRHILKPIVLAYFLLYVYHELRNLTVNITVASSSSDIYK